MRKKVLVVEDSPEYLQIVQLGLASKYDVLVAENGAEAIKVLNEQGVDLVLLDVILPDMHGHQICDFIRSQPKFNDVPVLFLTGQDQIEEKIAGFEHGADDYLTKPFHLKELLARVAANLRKFDNLNTSHIKIGDLSLDTQKQNVSIGGKLGQEELTRIEFKLLVYLAKHPDWVLSRDQLLEKVWPDKMNVSDRTIDSHISNLRKKLIESSVSIKAVHGSGYRLRIEEKKAA